MNYQNAAYYQTLSHYNRWANARLLAAVETLPDNAYHADRNGFFKSIGNTLNHILVADTIWTARLQGGDAGLTDLSIVLYPGRAALIAAREKMDEAIIAYFAQIADSLLSQSLTYLDTRGMTFSVPYPIVFGHFFNHQTHHRGQLHHMLTHAGLTNPPELDFIYYFHERQPAA